MLDWKSISRCVKPATGNIRRKRWRRGSQLKTRKPVGVEAEKQVWSWLKESVRGSIVVKGLGSERSGLGLE